LVHSIQTSVATYEREVLTECVGSHKKLVFINPSAVEINEQLIILKEHALNPLEKIQDLITTEQRDLEVSNHNMLKALLQAI
jgi:hypothetical protein